MNRYKKNLDKVIRNYEFFRYVIRVIELISLAYVITVVLLLRENILTLVILFLISCLFYEVYLGFYRSFVNRSVNEFIENKQREIEVLKKQLARYKDLKNRANEGLNICLSHEDAPILSDELRELVEKEKNGLGWFSIRIKKYELKCSYIMKQIENLENQIKEKERLAIF